MKDIYLKISETITYVRKANGTASQPKKIAETTATARIIIKGNNTGKLIPENFNAFIGKVQTIR